MVKLKINGKEYEVEEGRSVLQTCLDLGIYIPHFCYHPDLSVAGNCRMCLVDIKPGPPKLSISCATTVAEGMEIQTENEKVAAARQAVLEFMLKNHPVDCPICDQAGECWLQNNYYDYDLQPSRLLGPQEKVKKRKAWKVGPTLVLDAERCILCSRCIRFMREVAGEDCLTIKNRSERSEITFVGDELTNPYSLCLADLCPVGAWTDRDFRFKQRAWLLESEPSICPQCARGCNIWIDRRRQEVYRIRPRANPGVNKSFACDEGRLAYHALNDLRLGRAVLKSADGCKQVRLGQAIERAAQIIREAGSNLAVVVSASLSLEEAGKVLSLFRDKRKARLYLHTGEPGWSDAILRCADRNANTRGLEQLGITNRDLAGIPESAVLVYFETICPNPLPKGMAWPAIVASPQVSPAVEQAVVALPAASFAESSGTLINIDGLEQKYGPALRLKEDARPHLELIELIAAALEQKQVC